MPDKYQAAVYAFYLKKRENLELSDQMINPKPSGLRDEAKMFYNMGREGLDILRYFTKEPCYPNQPLGTLDIDKFKPVRNFLTKRTIDPNSRVVELIAWMIDFPLRPSVKYYEEQSNINDAEVATKAGLEFQESTALQGIVGVKGHFEVAGTELIESGKDNEVDSVGNGSREPSKTQISKDKIGEEKGHFMQLTSRNIAIFICLFLALSSSLGAVYLIMKDGEKCMYWAGDHYERISCDSKMGDVPIIAFDEVKAKHFKKITKPDTITLNSINRVWYSRMNNDQEYFSWYGNHPVYTNKMLKPLTVYMYNQHILSKRNLKNN